MFPTTAPPQVGRDMARIISWQRIVDFQLRNRSHLRLVLYNILRCLSVCSQYVNWAGLSRSFIHLLPLSLTGGGAREPITGLTYREQTTIRTQSQIRVFSSPIQEEPTQTGQGFGAIGFLSLSMCTSTDGNRFSVGRLFLYVNMCPHHHQCITLHTDRLSGIDG